MPWVLPLLAESKLTRFMDGFRAPLLAGAIALALVLLLTPYVIKFAIKRGAIDDPTQDDRRVHKDPTPRWGGLAIFAGIVIALLVVLPFAYKVQPFPPYLLGMLLLGTCIVIMGAMDDLYQFKARFQMLFLLAVGVAIQFFYDPIGRIQISGIDWPLFSAHHTWIPFGWLGIPITAIYIFVVTKTMDTIDGIDGLAAGLAGITGAALSVVATYGGQPRVALIAAALSGACFGFLRYNYNPAKIFMGTGGAQLLGFFLACLSIVGAFKTVAATFSIIVPLLVFGVPFFDAAFVVTRRILSRQPITQADKRHLHHTLLNMGLSQRQTVWVLYVLAAILCGALLVIVRVNG